MLEIIDYSTKRIRAVEGYDREADRIVETMDDDGNADGMHGSLCGII